MAWQTSNSSQKQTRNRRRCAMFVVAKTMTAIHATLMHGKKTPESPPST